MCKYTERERDTHTTTHATTHMRACAHAHTHNFYHLNCKGRSHKIKSCFKIKRETPNSLSAHCQLLTECTTAWKCNHLLKGESTIKSADMATGLQETCCIFYHTMVHICICLFVFLKINIRTRQSRGKTTLLWHSQMIYGIYTFFRVIRLQMADN